jgi:nuclear GTP-binding protein
MGRGKNHSSKRVTLHQKYKIQKKVREHHRKLRKAEKVKAKKQGLKVSELRRKDPGVPNLWPFKEQILREVEEYKEQVAKDKAQQLQERKRARDKIKKNSQSDKPSKKSVSDVRNSKPVHDPKNPRQFFYTGLHDVIETSDLFLEVIDARDPIGCRPVEIEHYIKERDSSKRIILVLNKIDLVPIDVVEKWVQHLSNEHPTIALRCASSAPAHADDKAEAATPSAPIGVDHLLQLLKTLAAGRDAEAPLVVGIIGFPNAGKRSLISALAAARAAELHGAGTAPAVAAATGPPGIALDRRVRLVERAGDVLARDEKAAAAALSNCVKFRGALEPVRVVRELVPACDRVALMRLYKLARFRAAAAAAPPRRAHKCRARVRPGINTRHQRALVSSFTPPPAPLAIPFHPIRLRHVAAAAPPSHLG